MQRRVQGGADRYDLAQVGEENSIPKAVQPAQIQGGVFALCQRMHPDPPRFFKAGDHRVPPEHERRGGAVEAGRGAEMQHVVIQADQQPGCPEPEHEAAQGALPAALAHGWRTTDFITARARSAGVTRLAGGQHLDLMAACGERLEPFQRDQQLAAKIGGPTNIGKEY